MDQKKITERTAEIILRYYENDPLPFLNSFDEEALWYGPAQGQFIKGRKAMLDIWKKERHLLTFTVGDMKSETISCHPSSCNVMLSYPVVTHYPDGHDISVDQRLLLCWGDRRITDENGHTVKEPRILVCHISNPHGKHEDDVIYPKNFDQVYAGRDVSPQKGKRLHFHGTDRSDYYFMSDSIIWAEASGSGKHTILHGTNVDTEVNMPISAIEEAWPELFMRCHQSYLINPHYIRGIRRFEVTLTNGMVLPIPEKKYTAFREKAAKLLRE